MFWIPPWQMRVKTVRAGDLPVGSVVKLMEGGTAVEYLVVNQGIPSNSSLYDVSCDGTWLLRKGPYSIRAWDTSGASTYANSTINNWLNGDFFNSLGSVEQATIKQVKIPYRVGGGDDSIKSGAKGLSVKVFLLGTLELGFSTAGGVPEDGAKLSYFESGTGTSANAKRSLLYYIWWMRSVSTGNYAQAWVVLTDGSSSIRATNGTCSVRPALIIPPNALFDKTTMILKGVS